MSNSGNQRGGGSPHMSAQRRAGALAKLQTPLGPQDYPKPAPVKRQGLLAPMSLQAVPSRLSRAEGAS